MAGKPTLGLTQRQRDALRVLIGFVADHKRSPSLREWALRLGVKIPGVTHLRDALVKKGYVAHDPGRTGGVRLTDKGISGE